MQETWGTIKFTLDNIFLHNVTSLKLQLWRHKCSFIWKTANQDILKKFQEKNSLIICEFFEKILTSSLQVWHLAWHHIQVHHHITSTFMNEVIITHTWLYSFSVTLHERQKFPIFLNLRLKFLHHKASLIFYIECNHLFLLLNNFSKC